MVYQNYRSPSSPRFIYIFVRNLFFLVIFLIFVGHTSFRYPSSPSVCVYESDKTVRVLNYLYVQHIYDMSDSIGRVPTCVFDTPRGSSSPLHRQQSLTLTTTSSKRHFRSLKMTNDTIYQYNMSEE